MEVKTNYLTQTSQPTPMYPGSQLEILVEALEDIKLLLPAYYTEQVEKTHDRLKEVLYNESRPTALIRLLDVNPQ